jgi:hypothetical protein
MTNWVKKADVHGAVIVHYELDEVKPSIEMAKAWQKHWKLLSTTWLTPLMPYSRFLKTRTIQN